ncbi:MAG: hypothetical protein KGH60_03055 [Candidatus Micrarchaeota archaeon]|nr:hypothetical protein [Candidatus Micrarchaeota archaeon]
MERQRLALAGGIVAAGLALLLLLYFIQGPAWDLVTHYLNAKGFMSQFFLSKAYAIQGSLTIQNGTTYIEIFRDALSPSIFMLLIPIFSNPILPYLILVYAMFAASILVMARQMRMDYLVSLALFISPYFIMLSLFINSEELLSVIFMLIALGLLYKKHPVAGLFIGLAGLGKETALIFLPMVVFLGGSRKVMAGLALFVAVTAPWLAFNAYFFGSPIASYVAAIDVNVLGNAPLSVPLIPFLGAIAYPIAILAFGLSILGAKRARAALSAFMRRDIARLLLVFLVLSVVASTAVSLRKGQFDQLRYGYLIAMAVCVIAAAILDKWSSDRGFVARIAMAAIAVAAASCLYYLLVTAPGTNSLAYNANNPGSVLSQAKAELASLGYANCRVVSNAWPYMIYEGVGAYAPYSFNSSVGSYPIVAFGNGYGVPLSSIINLDASKTAYSSNSFSILLPSKAMCVT